MKRKLEIFSRENKLEHTRTITCAPRHLFPQERDWSDDIACIRTLMSMFTNDIPTEDRIITKYKIKPGTYFSSDAKIRGLLSEYDVIYGCDYTSMEFDYILDLAEHGYAVMLESLHNYSHWMVLLGYYVLDKDNIEKNELLLYDPYYNKIRIICVDEYIEMWVDGNVAETHVINDFVAIREKS